MIAKEQLIRRLEHIADEIAEMRRTVQDGLEADGDATQAFLAKCHGWEDNRRVDDIIAEIYLARTSSERGAQTFR